LVKGLQRLDLLSYINLIKENGMKKDIHPDYKVCTVTCACGNSFETKSNVETLKIDICSSCHPFFTGEQKIVDAAGRVEKFKAKYNMAK
jgi:large subunit ribosomal protein L31